ncbi:MAG: FecR domain-containing protein [Bacteriovoracia bacterium]
MGRKLIAIVMALFGFVSLSVFADQNTATITKKDGLIQIFSNPGKSVQGPPPHALYEGEYYSVKDANVGDKVENGNIVRTAPGAIAKIVYDNGDQVNVGPGTAYRVFFPGSEAKDTGKTSMNLLYGKLRSVVSKVGPRNNLEVKTANATMGVRGTDFYVSTRGVGNRTDLTILRGAVALKPKTVEKGKKVKVVEVKAGDTATVVSNPVKETRDDSKKVAKIEPKVEIAKTDQEELKEIKQNTEVKETASAPKEVAEKVKKLETKAVEATLQDIKATDPKLYAQVSKKGFESSDQLNDTTVDKLMKTAPEARHKPSKRDLDKTDIDAYDLYFKKVD